MERIEAVKHEVASLQKQAHYESFRESFAPTEAQIVPEDMINSWVDALTIRTFNEELKGVFPYIYKLVSEKREGELGYEDLVAEEAECSVCHKDPCECDDEEDVKEHSMFQEFEDQIDEIGELDHEKDSEEPPFDGPYSKNQGDVKDKSGAVHTGQSRARHLAKQAIPTEVVEFIQSMYDSQTGTFPRGEEGVKIACEKKFGEQAGQFAHYVVEKLSTKAMGATENEGILGTIAGGVAGAALGGPMGALTGAAAGDQLTDPDGEEDESVDPLVRIRELAKY
jgi:hypothetical protein